MTTVYLIQDPANELWYTNDHTQEPPQRWSPNMQDAYQASSYAVAESEIADDSELILEYYRIVEILIK